jgi:ribonuclease E
MIGRVVGSEVLAQMVKVRLPDGSPEVFAIEEIIERNCDEPEIQERSDRRGRRDAPRDRSNMPRLRDAVAEPEQTPSDDELGTRASEASGPSDGVANEGDKSEGAPRKRRRRGGRRRRKKNTNPDAPNHAGDSTPTGDGPNEG